MGMRWTEGESEWRAEVGELVALVRRRSWGWTWQVGLEASPGRLDRVTRMDIEKGHERAVDAARACEEALRVWLQRALDALQDEEV